MEYQNIKNTYINVSVNRGFRVTNYALVPNRFPIENVKSQSNLFVIGLISEVQHLVNIRRNRLDYLRDKSNASYINEENVTNELNSSKKLFLNNGWPVLMFLESQ